MLMQDKSKPLHFLVVVHDIYLKDVSMRTIQMFFLLPIVSKYSIFKFFRTSIANLLSSSDYAANELYGSERYRNAGVGSSRPISIVLRCFLEVRNGKSFSIDVRI